MKKLFTAVVALVTMLMCCCSNGYDDSAVWKEINDLLNQITALQSDVESLNSQVSALSTIVNGGAVSSITTDSDGNCVMGYIDQSGVERTITIATHDKVTTAPIIGIKADQQIYYWTITTGGKTTWLADTDGERIPVSGRTPTLGIDSEGYWTVNGTRLTDFDGKPVKAEGKQMSLITEVSFDANGNAVITLGDGTALTVKTFTALQIAFDVETQTTVADLSKAMVINYTISGANADQAVADIAKRNGVEATINTSLHTITVTFPEGFEEGSIMVMVCDNNDNVIIKPLYFAVPIGETTGISNSSDLIAFANAVNGGGSLTRFKDDNGEVVLNNDIDMTGITDWTPIGSASTDVTAANTAPVYNTSGGFDGTFNGKGFAIKNIEWTFNLADGKWAYGLFGALKEGAVVKNLTMGSADHHGSITLGGAASQGTATGAIAAVNNGGTITTCTNYVDINFAGSDAANTMVSTGGIAGALASGTIGGATEQSGCTNYGTISCGAIVNTANGANSGMHTGGIVGVVVAVTENLVSHCTNNGSVSGPSGRSGGIVAVQNGGTMAYCTNNGQVEDDKEGVFASNSAPYNLKRLGGLAGGTGSTAAIAYCTNNGNVFSQLGCRTGGLVGHNAGTIDNCTNTGVVLSDHITVGTAYHGAGWACGFNGSTTNITNTPPAGRVGDYTVYKDAPQTAPVATYANAVCHSPANYTPSLNGLSDTDDNYYDWTVAETRTLAKGAQFTHYSFTNIAQHIFVVEIDWTNTDLELTTVLSDDAVPNSNNNNRNNNGKNLRETCSETCVRRRAEGQNVIAGINTGFFDSQEGILRGLHIEEGRPDYVNNPAVRDQLTNHAPCFGVLKDRSLTFAKKDFIGKIELEGTEYEYYSVNDTILRNPNTSYPVNLYTARLKHEVHASTGITFDMNPKALYVVAANNDGKVLNTGEGWYDATITAIVDGRSGSAIDLPYVTSNDQWVVQLTGDKADQMALQAAVGKAIKIKADVTLDGTVASPILTLNSSMAHFIKNGVQNGNDNELYPMTVVGSNKDNTKVYLVVVDGRSTVSGGLTLYQMYRVGIKLGVYNMVRFDGGGSSTMWLWDDTAKTGGVVNQVCDSNGERSCMNYMHLRIK